MRQEWLKDLLAVAETGSFQAAADVRGITQPAFSRRLRQIETQLGAQLFDRSHRPARMLPHVLGHIEDMRELSDGLTGLAQALRRADHGARNRIEIACQHAIAISFLPQLMDRLRPLELQMRVRSANREDCLAQLLVGQADLAILYDTDDEPIVAGSDAVERAVIARDDLVAVFSAAMGDVLRSAGERGELPIIAFPRDVFFGRVFWTSIVARLPLELTPMPRIETALTPAARQFALSGLGVAWLPRSLVASELQQGQLVDLGDRLPGIGLKLVVMRRTKDVPAFVDAVWRALAER